MGAGEPERLTIKRLNHEEHGEHEVRRKIEEQRYETNEKGYFRRALDDPLFMFVIPAKAGIHLDLPHLK